MRNGRGILTTQVNKIAKKIIGREISEDELRLIPYIQYIMTNEQQIELNKLKPKEYKILDDWRLEGFIKGGLTGLVITKKFWDFMCEILFEAYVKINPEKIDEIVQR